MFPNTGCEHMQLKLKFEKSETFTSSPFQWQTSPGWNPKQREASFKFLTWSVVSLPTFPLQIKSMLAGPVKILPRHGVFPDRPSICWLVLLWTASSYSLCHAAHSYSSSSLRLPLQAHLQVVFYSTETFPHCTPPTTTYRAYTTCKFYCYSSIKNL